MTSLNDLLSKARLPLPSGVAKDVRGQIASSMRSTSNEIRNIPAGIASQAVNSAKGAVSQAVSGGLSNLRGAANAALRGDFSGALTQLQQGPQDFMKSFGLSTGGAGSSGGPSGLAVNPLEGALGRSDPMLSFQWYCELPTLTPLGKQPVSLDWNYVEEATPPFRSFEVRSVYAQGRNRHYAGPYNVDQMPLNFYADIAGKSWAYLKAWQQCMLPAFASTEYTKGGGFGRPSNYQKTIKLYLLAPDMSKVMYFELIECWPVNLDALHLDSASSTRLTFNPSFSVGDVFTAVFGVNDNIAGANLVSSLQNKALNTAMNILF